MIRRMNFEDVDSIVDIWFEASVKAHRFMSREFWEEKRAAMHDIYIPNSETWVVEERGRVVGFYSFVDETLAAIFVQPECQGQGLGERLLKHAKSRRNRIELSVYVENEPSYRFYCKHGFVLVREQLDENTGHSEYLMEWRAQG